MADETIEFGSLSEVGAGKRTRNPNVRWLGAKFDATDDNDKEIIEMADKLGGRVGGGMKKLIAELVSYAYKNEFGE